MASVRTGKAASISYRSTSLVLICDVKIIAILVFFFVWTTKHFYLRNWLLAHKKSPLFLAFLAVKRSLPSWQRNPGMRSKKFFSREVLLWARISTATHPAQFFPKMENVKMNMRNLQLVILALERNHFVLSALLLVTCKRLELIRFSSGYGYLQNNLEMTFYGADEHAWCFNLQPSGLWSLVSRLALSFSNQFHSDWCRAYLNRHHYEIDVRFPVYFNLAPWHWQLQNYSTRAVIAAVRYIHKIFSVTKIFPNVLYI